MKLKMSGGQPKWEHDRYIVPVVDEQGNELEIGVFEEDLVSLLLTGEIEIEVDCDGVKH